MADTLRDATIADLDDMTEIMCSAMPMDPAWNYRFPRRKEFPEDHWRCVREDIEKILDPGSRSHRSVKVITIPRTNGKGDRAVALAVWELPFLGHSEISSNNDCTTRRDADLAHIAAFRSVLVASVNKYFDTPYGDSQVQLYHLATHPDYQRHGAGTRLLNWGLELAMREKKPITLFGSPMGTKLYTELGFRLLDYVTVQVDGEEEKVSLCVMLYDKQ